MILYPKDIKSTTEPNDNLLVTEYFNWVYADIQETFCKSVSKCVKL